MEPERGRVRRQSHSAPEAFPPYESRVGLVLKTMRFARVSLPLASKEWNLPPDAELILINERSTGNTGHPATQRGHTVRLPAELGRRVSDIPAGCAEAD